MKLMNPGLAGSTFSNIDISIEADKAKAMSYGGFLMDAASEKGTFDE